jgi:hypothetical protein
LDQPAQERSFGLSRCLIHHNDLSSACWKFLPLGGPLTLGILHSYHFSLNAVASVLTSSSASIFPFPVSIITTRWYVAILDDSSFKGFSRMRTYPGNNGSPVKEYLLVLFPYFRVCVLGNPTAIPMSILFLARCMQIISSHYICAWMRCTHSFSRDILLVFFLFCLWINLSSLQRKSPILHSIDRTVVSYLLLWCDHDLHYKSCLNGGLSRCLDPTFPSINSVPSALTWSSVL